VLHPVARGTLLLLAAGIVAVFSVARALQPSGADGRPYRLETHTQLGLPPCWFLLATGKPCPACGLTTSIVHLLHGDVASSLRANAVGTGLAVFLAGLVPWSLVCAVRGQWLWIHSPDRAVTWALLIVTVLLLVRWAVIMVS
jgi:hypothetical protein